MPNIYAPMRLAACLSAFLFANPAAAHRHHHIANRHLAPGRGYEIVTADNGAIIGSRPDGCPHAYCGCGLRKYLGLTDNRLNLASNWLRFFVRVPHPRAGVAAVRNHHVMYLESQAADGEWMVRNFNSGGGLSRLHVHDVRGYIFVDPHAEARH